MRGTTPLKVSGGRVSFERLALAEAVRPEAPSGVPTLVTLSGSAQFVAPRSLDVAANGSVDASLLGPAFAPLKARGPRHARRAARGDGLVAGSSRAARPSTASTS